MRTAIARGNDRGQVLRRHVLKNALSPVITFLAQTMAELVAGSIVVEQVFVIPGLGRMLVTSIAGRDYPVVQAIVVVKYSGLLGGAGGDGGRSHQSADRPQAPAGRRGMKRRNWFLVAGLLLTGLLAALLLLGLFWTPYDPNAMAAGPKFGGPSPAHWMGTDNFGRDIFSRVLKGAGATASIALATLAIGAACGCLI